MYVCTRCLCSFLRPRRQIDRKTYEENYYCPICGSDSIEFEKPNRKEDEDDTND